MHLSLRPPYKFSHFIILAPWAILTILLLIYRGLQKYYLNPEFSFREIISVGVLFSSGLWLILLPVVYLAHKQYSLKKLGWLKFILSQLFISICLGLLQSYSFVYLHHLIWPSILVPDQVLTPMYLLSDLRLNFFIYWVMLLSFILFESIQILPIKPQKNEIIKEDLLYHQIAFVKALGNYVMIKEIVEGEFKTKILRRRMYQMLNLLPSPQFMRVHRSFIINKDYIESFTKAVHGEYQLKLKTGEVISTSRDRKKKIKTWLESFISTS